MRYLQIVEIQKGLSLFVPFSSHMNLQIVEIQKGLSHTELITTAMANLQIVEIQKGLSHRITPKQKVKNLQIVEIQKGLSLFCFAKVQQIPDIECVFA